MRADIVKKMKWKTGMDVILLNPSSGYDELWEPLEGEGQLLIQKRVSDMPEKTFPFVHLFVGNVAELEAWGPVAVRSVEYDGLLWISYPKKTAGKTDLNRDRGWETILEAGLEGVALVSIDEKWSAMRFRPIELVPSTRSTREKSTDNKDVSRDTDRTVIVPDDLQLELDKHTKALAFFSGLAYTHRKEYVRWITDAKRAETRASRIEKTINRLSQGIKNPSVKVE